MQQAVHTTHTHRHRALPTTVLLLLALLAPRVHAQFASFDFLRIPMNARAAALANTFVAMRQDPAAILHNPANVSMIEGQVASAGFMKHLLDVNAGFVSYARPIENIGWVSGAVTYMNYGDNDKRDRFGTSLGTFGAADLAVSLGYANAMDNLHYGGAVKVLYSYIDTYSASGLALDAGLTYDLPKEQWTFGASLQNLGMQLSSFGEEKENLPLDLRVGAGKKLEHLPLLFLFEFHGLTNSYDAFFDRFANFSLGGEFTLSTALKLRLGYANQARKDWKVGETAKLSGFSAGLGINVRPVQLDYAFTSMGDIGAQHRITLGAAF
jgi:hypothetical protein